MTCIHSPRVFRNTFERIGAKCFYKRHMGFIFFSGRCWLMGSDRWRTCCISSLSNIRAYARCSWTRALRTSSMRTIMTTGVNVPSVRVPTNSVKPSFGSGDDYDKKATDEKRGFRDSDTTMVMSPCPNFTHIIMLVDIFSRTHYPAIPFHAVHRCHVAFHI